MRSLTSSEHACPTSGLLCGRLLVALVESVLRHSRSRTHHQLSDGAGSIFVSFRKASSGVMIAANVFHTAGMSASTLAGSPSALVNSARYGIVWYACGASGGSGVRRWDACRVVGRA